MLFRSRHALGTDYAVAGLDTFFLPFLRAFDDILEQVDVEATAEAPVGAHYDVANVLHFPLLQVNVPVFQSALAR